MNNSELKNYAIILASGRGERFGKNIPKQFVKILGKTILERSVEIFEQNKRIDGIVVVITPEYFSKAKNILKKHNKIYKILVGGDLRKDSSYIGINSIEEKEANVLIHDCARPLLSQEVLNKCLDELGKYNALTVSCKTTDTILEVENNKIKNILQRDKLRNVQTPQCFKLSLIKKAHELSKNDNNFTDDCALIIKHGLGKIHVVDGDISNIKITYPKDLYIARQILKEGL